MVRKPSKLILRALPPPCMLRTAALVSVLLVASFSGLGIFMKRVIVQTLRRQMLRVIWGQDMQEKSTHGEATALTVATAVKAASSAAAQVACLSQLMLTIRAEEKHQNRIVVSALQAVSSKITKAELIMRANMDKIDRAKKQSSTNCKPSNTSQSDQQTSTHRAASFMEVMAMLERGETPPGIKEINDKPPIPNQLPSVSCLQPKPKPWEMER